MALSFHLEPARGVSFEEASLTEPLAVTLHAAKTAGKGTTVAVMGLGPIGLLVTQWAKLMGATTVIGVDRNQHRFDIAKQMGIADCIDTREKEAPQAIRELTDDAGADIVFECSGSEELQQQGILSAAKRGKIVVLGNPTKSLFIDQQLYARIVRNEITLTGSWSSLIHNGEWAEALDAIKRKDIQALPVITHGFHLSETSHVIADMFYKRFEFSKVNLYL